MMFQIEHFLTAPPQHSPFQPARCSRQSLPYRLSRAGRV